MFALKELLAATRQDIDTMQLCLSFMHTETGEKLCLLAEDIQITGAGVQMTTSESPFVVVDYLEDRFDVVFTRELTEGGVYDWVTHIGSELDNFEFRILACEIVDLTGSLVKPNTNEKQ